MTDAILEVIMTHNKETKNTHQFGAVEESTLPIVYVGKAWFEENGVEAGSGRFKVTFEKVED